MLVLSRKPGEKVIIGKDITLTVVEVRGDRVGLENNGLCFVVAPRRCPGSRESARNLLLVLHAQAEGCPEKAQIAAGETVGIPRPPASSARSSSATARKPPAKGKASRPRTGRSEPQLLGRMARSK